MSGNTPNNPKLFISPPIINGHTTPSHFKNARRKDADKERQKPQTRDIAKLQIKGEEKKRVKITCDGWMDG